VTGMEEDAVAGSELFTLSDGGALQWTGIRPRCAERLDAGGFPWERFGADRASSR